MSAASTTFSNADSRDWCPMTARFESHCDRKSTACMGSLCSVGCLATPLDQSSPCTSIFTCPDFAPFPSETAGIPQFGFGGYDRSPADDVCCTVMAALQFGKF